MTNANILPKKERVITYIDGFNLYFGMIEAGLDYCKWLNLSHLVECLLNDGQELIKIKYFTSRINGDPDKQKRQGTYIEALETTGIEIIYGKLERRSIQCKRCLNIWPDFNEKMTDVNIAMHLINDAYQNLYDTAFLISGDTDLSPSIILIHQLFKDKRVFIAFPPRRSQESLKLLAKGSMVIGRGNLVNSQFEEEITKKNGYKLKKPKEWI